MYMSLLYHIIISLVLEVLLNRNYLTVICNASKGSGKPWEFPETICQNRWTQPLQCKKSPLGIHIYNTTKYYANKPLLMDKGLLDKPWNLYFIWFSHAMKYSFDFFPNYWKKGKSHSAQVPCQTKQQVVGWVCSKACSLPDPLDAALCPVVGTSLALSIHSWKLGSASAEQDKFLEVL